MTADGSTDCPARFAVDLHSHTTCSDGAYSPAQLVEAATRRGLSALAITDHDTIDGIAVAHAAAAEAPLEIIPGIEISAWLEREIHILGYFIDPASPELTAALAHQREARVNRVTLICDRLRALGAHLDPEAILTAVGDGTVGRPHIARALVQAGHARHFDDAFKRYLGADAPAYIPAAHLSAEATIRLIHRSGGAAVIAHPGVESLAEHLPRLAAHGLDGVETEHPAHTRATARRYRGLARRLGLLRTGGSDFHGPGRTDIGSLGVDLPALEDLRQRARRYSDAGATSRIPLA